MTNRKWYTPSGFLCMLLHKHATGKAPPEKRLITSALYGVIEIHGVLGGVKLYRRAARAIAQNRKERAKRNKGKAKAVVSGVRDGVGLSSNEGSGPNRLP